MWFEKARPYKPLLGDSEDQSDADESATATLRRLHVKRDFWPWKLASAIHWLVTAVLIIVVAVGVYREKKLHSRCVRDLHTPSPIVEAGAIDHYDTVFFNGTINFREKWAGTPNDARDRLWKSMIYADVWIPITDDDVRKMGKDPKSVVRVPPKYREDYGDGAVVVMDFAHQMHCLDLVRKYTYFDYYMEKQDEEAFGNPPHVLRVHIDHCIDMLRQFVMCNADPGMVTHFWIEGRPTPYPDFSMQKQCKDPHALLRWAMERRIPDYKPMNPSPGEAIFPWDPEIL